MDEMKKIFADNLISLRTAFKMTQAELAEKINYSDKSISKWERGEALPDLPTVKHLADLFGVTVDWMLMPHEGKTSTTKIVQKLRSFNEKTVMAVAFIGTWTAAVLLFVIFWILGDFVWLIPLVAMPVSLTVLLVLNSVWGKSRFNQMIIMFLVASLFGMVYYLINDARPWQLIFVFVLAELLVVLSYKIKRKKKNKNNPKNSKNNPEHPTPSV